MVPGAEVGVTPVAGGASVTALPSVMQELAKFFMNLSGSSSLGASGGLAGVTALGAASGGIACPASTAAGAATVSAATDACWGWSFACCSRCCSWRVW